MYYGNKDIALPAFVELFVKVTAVSYTHLDVYKRQSTLHLIYLTLYSTGIFIVYH